MKEQKLIYSLKQDNDRAWKMLYSLHYQALCAFAYNYVKDRLLAEMIVGDAIVHLWEIRERLELQGSLRSYLMAMVRNGCMNFMNTRQMRTEVPMSSLDKSPDGSDWILAESSPLGQLLEKELEKEIKVAVATIPPDSRRVFALSRFGGKSYEEIAQEIGISVNTVKYHMKRALQHLRSCLGRYL